MPEWVKKLWDWLKGRAKLRLIYDLDGDGTPDGHVDLT